MSYRVIVWGTGNVGRPALRAVLSHRDLSLAGVVVNDPNKVGSDAGSLAGVADTGIKATSDWQALLAAGADAVVYCATADTRPEEAQAELLACLEAGCNVVSPAFYSLLDPLAPAHALSNSVSAACEASGTSLLVSGIDPGWAMDMLPLAVSGTSSAITGIRSREIFNYALYDQPEVVREVIGFGGDLGQTPLMLHDFAIEMVWAPMLRLVARGLGQSLGELAVEVERRPLEQDVEVPGMGLFQAGTQGAFRFEISGLGESGTRFALEHVTRIDDNCARDWPYPASGRGCHQVIVTGNPTVHIELHAEDRFEPGAAGGGNASAASWLVNAIPAVCAAGPGALSMLDLPRIDGGGQLTAS